MRGWCNRKSHGQQGERKKEKKKVWIQKKIKENGVRFLRRKDDWSFKKERRIKRKEKGKRLGLGRRELKVEEENMEGVGFRRRKEIGRR